MATGQHSKFSRTPGEENHEKEGIGNPVNAKGLFERKEKERKEKIGKLEKEINSYLEANATVPREPIRYDAGVQGMYVIEEICRRYEPAGWEVEVFKDKGKESPTILTFYAKYE